MTETSLRVSQPQPARKRNTHRTKGQASYCDRWRHHLARDAEQGPFMAEQSARARTTGVEEDYHRQRWAASRAVRGQQLKSDEELQTVVHRWRVEASIDGFAIVLRKLPAKCIEMGGEYV